MSTKSALAYAAGLGGGGGGPFDPRDVTIYILERQLAEFRAAMRRLLDAEGEDAIEAIAEAERLCDGYDQIDREDEAEREMEAHYFSPVCDCGTFKGTETSYCPECDAETLARLKEREAAPPSNVVTINSPF